MPILRAFTNKFGLRISLPKTRMVHGIPIQKAPIGRYLEALEAMEDLPKLIIDTAFPGKTWQEVFPLLAKADTDFIMQAAMRLLTALPDRIIEAVCVVIGAKPRDIRERLSPAELLDVLEAFWEENRLADFFTKAGQVTQMPAMRQPSSESSPAR